MARLLLTSAVTLAALVLPQSPFAEGLVAPPGHRPPKKIVGLFETKCAACHGEDGKGNT
jgi:cytochrome c